METVFVSATEVFSVRPPAAMNESSNGSGSASNSSVSLNTWQSSTVHSHHRTYHTFVVLFVLGFIVLIVVAYRFKRLCCTFGAVAISSLFSFGMFTKLHCFNDTCAPNQLTNLDQAKKVALASSVLLLSLTISFYYITTKLLQLRQSLNVAILLLVACPFVFFYGVLGLVTSILQLRSLEVSDPRESSESPRLAALAFQWTQVDMFLYYGVITGIVWTFLEDLVFIRRKAHHDFHFRSAKYNWYRWFAEEQEHQNTVIDQYRYFQQLFDEDQRQFEKELELNRATSQASPQPPIHSSSRPRSRVSFVSDTHSLVPLVRFTHHWTLDQFITLDYSEDASPFVESDPFCPSPLQSAQFRLRLYPRGSGENHEVVSLFLRLDTDVESNCGPFMVGFVCSILDSTGVSRHLKEKRCMISGKDNLHGWDDFIDRNQLLNSVDLLPDERLTVRCEINFPEPD